MWGAIRRDQAAHRADGPGVLAGERVEPNRPDAEADETTVRTAEKASVAPVDAPIEPPWLSLARNYIGTEEIPGPEHNWRITRWLVRLKAFWTDDETPWCGVFVAAMLQDYADLPPVWARARAWLDWGQELEHPELGCVVVFERGPTMGHVGFVAGRDLAGNLMVLGGNQGNRVSIAAFPRSRVLGYRWPKDHEIVAAALPLGEAQTSRSEA